VNAILRALPVTVLLEGRRINAVVWDVTEQCALYNDLPPSDHAYFYIPWPETNLVGGREVSGVLEARICGELAAAYEEWAS
jgi:hypothetical protein